MSKFGGIGRKYAEIDLDGRKTLENPGEIEGFQSPENWESNFNVVAEFDAESREEIESRILSKLKEIEAELRLPLLIAGRDFALHTTVQLASQSEDPERQKRLFEELMSDNKISASMDSMVGVPVEYKYILIDKGNVLLGSVDMPEAILKAREEIGKNYELKGVKPVSYENILHITLARITDSSGEGKEAVPEEYRNRLIKLRHEISSQPITVTIDRVVRGHTSDLLKIN